MKTVAQFISIVLLTLLSLPVSPAQAAEEGSECREPHIELQSATVDLGEISTDTVIRTSIRFQNTGQSHLQIISVFSDCGCTTTFFPNEPILPGKSGKIEIEFNPKGRQPGSFRKVLRIRSNADNPRVLLTVKGNIAR